MEQIAAVTGIASTDIERIAIEFANATDNAIVMGIGPGGISAVMVAKASHAKTIAIDPVQSRRDRALDRLVF